MAVSLKDVRNLRKRKKREFVDDKPKSLRPWQSYEELGAQTRTVTAREAVKKAVYTVQKNNLLVEKLKQTGFKHLTDSPKPPIISHEKLKIFKVYRLKKITGIFWFLRNILGRL